MRLSALADEEGVRKRMACQNLLQVIALAVLGLVCVAEASRSHLDCTNTYGGATLSTIENICSQVTDDQFFELAKDGKNPLVTLETIETCACALVNHELAWA